MSFRRGNKPARTDTEAAPDRIAPSEGGVLCRREKRSAEGKHDLQKKAEKDHRKNLPAEEKTLDTAGLLCYII